MRANRSPAGAESGNWVDLRRETLTSGILKRAGFHKENLKEEVYWVPGKAA